MSTEIFRKYIDLLNEAITQDDIDKLTPALQELERILGKYQGKIFEEDLPDPPLFAPDSSAPSPSGPKPRLKPLPGESREQFLKRVRDTADAAQRLGIRPGTAPTPTSTPSRFTPPDTLTPGRISGYTPEPEPSAISKAASKVWDATKAGASAATNLASKIPAPGWKTKVAAGVAGLAATAWGLWEGGKYLAYINSGYALRDLDPVDQQNINKYFKILEPYIAPEVIKELPADIQTRIVNVLGQLKKLGMAIKDGSEKSADTPGKTTAAPADGTPAGEESFSQTLQNAHRYVKGVRESVEVAHVSEAEKMAQLRDLVQEDVPSTVAAIAGSGITDQFLQQITTAGEALGLGYLAKRIPNYTLGLAALAKQFRAEVPTGEAKDFWKWLAKTHLPNKWDVGLGVAGAAAWAIYQYFQVKAVVGAKDAAVTALTQTWPAENNALKSFKDAMAKMTDAEYNALTQDQKDNIDETWIYYCSKFPSDKIGNQTCFDLKKDICQYHKDWAGCKI